MIPAGDEKPLRPDLVTPGETCWAVARADRLAFVVDGEQYFRAAKEAMLSARHSIMLVGWDFDARTRLEPRSVKLEGPVKLGRFVNWLAKRRPELEIRLLKWDVGMLRALWRGDTALFLLNWLTRRNVQLRLDGAHPTLAAHHMKLLVVDDSLAFCGGIDMTIGRWDTRQHREKERARRSPWGRPLGPWHDATTCISGEPARLLGQLARARWQRATGHELSPPPRVQAPWPATLPVHFENVEVGVARTFARFRDQPQVFEIEALTLRLILEARKTLYIENQYLASRTIARALAARLRQADGPEIVLVAPQSASGWLESKAMDSARSLLLHLIAEADVHGRFRIYHPVNEAGTPIYVHAKIMIADDRVLKIGSANLNNRSMGYDTEVDVVLDAERSESPDLTRQAIVARRDDLLAEHLGTTPEAVAGAIASTGSLIAAVEILNTGARKLVPISPRPLTADEQLIAETDLVDPERPSSLSSQLASIFGGALSRGRPG